MKKANIIIYSVIIVIALLITVFYLYPRIVQDELIYDAEAYATLSFSVDTLFAGTIRNVGYPAFLYAVRHLIPSQVFTDWYDGVRFVQWALHIMTAILCVGIYGKLTKNPRLLGRIITFACVALSPLLLALTQEILTDSVATFLLTLFIWCLLREVDFITALTSGLCIGVLYLFRPFYLPYLFALAGCVLLWLIISRRKQLTGMVTVRNMLLIATFALSFISLYSLQEIINRTYGDLETRQSASDYWIDLHFEQGQYTYKYETYVGLDATITPQQYYLSQDRLDHVQSQEDPTNLLAHTLQNPIDAVYMISIKLVGLFQSYEWSVYRQSAGTNAFHPLMIYGYFLFVGFVYVIQDFIVHIWSMLKRGELAIPIVWFAIMIQVGTYAVIFVPESRFVAQVVPLITTLAIARFIDDDRKHYAWITLIVATIMYVGTYLIIANASMIVPTR
ncbi:MAG: hypothetical protein AAF846_14065 [Chloroflexota bacterium]